MSGTEKPHLLEAICITVVYAGATVIRDVSFYAKECEVVAIVGPNGAGKSTLIKACSGLVHASRGRITRGSVLFEGEQITNMKTHELVRLGISVVPEARGIFSSMTVQENLDLGGFLISSKKLRNDARERVMQLFPNLKSKLANRAGCLSVGEQQMLAIGRALMLTPKVLLLDEPSLGLSPNYVEKLFERLTEIRSLGTTLVIAEQNVNMVLQVCDRGYVFGLGTIVMHGSKDVLREDARVAGAYFGT